jgi:hypothetical protein
VPAGGGPTEEQTVDRHSPLAPLHERKDHCG